MGELQEVDICLHRFAKQLAILSRVAAAVFVAAAFYSYADTVVVPDAGCGVFKNGPQVVGAALGRVLRNEFQGRFSEVAIACHNETFVHAAQATFEGREVLPIQTVEDAKGSFSPVSSPTSGAGP